jgi:omega-6 fatty acid desaturase (delta-12 desaturase)
MLSKMSSRREFTWDRVSLVLFLIIEAAALLLFAKLIRPELVSSTTHAAQLVACGIVLPYIVWSWLIGFITFQHHTNPRTTWFKDESEWSYFAGMIQNSVHLVFPRFIELMLHDVLDHTAHHADPNIPLYRLHASQRHLEQSFPGEIVVTVCNLLQFYRSLSICKLYDYENHQWLYFSGAPSAPPTLVNRAS